MKKVNDVFNINSSHSKLFSTIISVKLYPSAVVPLVNFSWCLPSIYNPIYFHLHYKIIELYDLCSYIFKGQVHIYICALNGIRIKIVCWRYIEKIRNFYFMHRHNVLYIDHKINPRPQISKIVDPQSLITKIIRLTSRENQCVHNP